MPAINILDLTGKHPAVPMKPRGAIVETGATLTSDAQKTVLQDAARAGLPPAPFGGKVNILA